MGSSPLRHGLRAVLAGFIACSVTHAQFHIWDGGGADNAWTTPGNWVIDMFFSPPPTTGAGTIIMQGTLRPNPFVDDDYDIFSLQFSGGGGAGPFTFQAGGEPLSIRGGGIVNNDTDLQIISRVALGASHTWNAAAGPLQVNFVTLGGLSTGSMLTVSGGFDTSIQGTVSGSVLSNAGSILLNSSANFTLAGVSANTFNGPVTVNGGTLLLNKPAGVNAVPGSLIIGDGAGSDVVKLIQSNQIADSSNVTINSSGLLNLNGGNETIGNLTLFGGSVALGAGTGVLNGNLSMSGGTVDTGTGALSVNGSLTLMGGNITGNGRLSVAAPFAMNAQTISLSGAPTLQFQSELTMTGSGIASGGGTLSLAGLHTVVAGSPSSITGRLHLPGSATFIVEDGAASDDLVISASLHGNRLVKTGPGQLLLSNTAGNGLSGLLVNDGTTILHGSVGTISVGSAHLQIAGSLSTSNLTALAGGLINTGAFQVSAGELHLNGGTITGNVRVGNQGAHVNAPNSVFNGTLSFSSSVSGTFIDADENTSAIFDGAILRGNGNATLILSDRGTITFAGAVANGTFLQGVTLGAIAAPETKLILAKSVVDGSVITENLAIGFNSLVKLGANEQILADVVTFGAGTLDLAGFSETLSDLHFSAGQVETGAGTLTLLGDIVSTNTGAIAGNLRFAGPVIHTIDVVPSGNVFNVPAAVFGNVILHKTGSGDLGLSGDNSFSGRLRLGAGRLTLLHDHAAGASTIEIEGGQLQLDGAPRNIANRINLLAPLFISTNAGSMTLSGTLDNSFGQSITFLGTAASDALIITGPQIHGAGASTILVDGRIRLASDSGAAGANLQIHLNGNTSPGYPSAQLEIPVTQHLAALNINLGAATLETGGDTILSTRSLGIGATNAFLNINEHAVIIDYTGPSPIASIKTAVLGAYNGGSWNGFGITSSLADATTFAIGYGEATALGLTSFEGELLDGAALLVKYTYYGDGNLDGRVDARDLLMLANGWLATGVWTDGDFNYDGFVDQLDLTLMARNWQAGHSAPLGHALERLPISVPEPAGLAAIALFTYSLDRRRRRRCPLRIECPP